MKNLSVNALGHDPKDTIEGQKNSWKHHSLWHDIKRTSSMKSTTVSNPWSVLLLSNKESTFMNQNWRTMLFTCSTWMTFSNLFTSYYLHMDVHVFSRQIHAILVAFGNKLRPSGSWHGFPDWVNHFVQNVAASHHSLSIKNTVPLLTRKIWNCFKRMATHVSW